MKITTCTHLYSKNIPSYYNTRVIFPGLFYFSNSLIEIAFIIYIFLMFPTRQNIVLELLSTTTTIRLNYTLIDIWKINALLMHINITLRNIHDLFPFLKIIV